MPSGRKPCKKSRRQSAEAAATYKHSKLGIPIFLGGDHAISAGTVQGLARRAAEAPRRIFRNFENIFVDLGSADAVQLCSRSRGHRPSRPGLIQSLLVVWQTVLPRRSRHRRMDRLQWTNR